MDHDLGIGQRHTLALGAGAQQKRAHRSRQTDADGRDIALNVLHGVVDGHTCGDAAAGAVDIELNVLIRILGFQVKQLGNHQACGGVVHFFGQEHDAVVQQTGENVIAALAAAGLLNNIGN